MKKINIVIIILLSLLSIYLLFRLFFNDGFDRSDYIILILITITGGINSLVVFNRRREKKERAG
jgi:hypothetical protein